MKKNLVSLFIFIMVIVLAVVAYKMDGRIFSFHQVKEGVSCYETMGRVYTFADIPRFFVFLGASYLLVTFCIRYYKRHGIILRNDLRF